MRDRVRVGALTGALSLLLVFAVAAVGSPIAESPVADAAMRGDIDAIRALLREGADVNAAQGDGMTALHWTALNGDVETMRVLVYAGANMDPLTRVGSYTPLHLASGEGHGEAVAFLVGAGSSPDAVTATGTQPIHLASQAGDPVAVAALVERGVDVNVKDSTHGRTPLIFAASQNRLEAMEILLGAGADVYLATTIVDYVERSSDDSKARQTRERVADAAAGREPGSRPDPFAFAAPAAQGNAAAAGGRRGAPPADPADPDDPPGTPRGRGARDAAAADPPDPDDPPGTPRAGQPPAEEPAAETPDDPPPLPDLSIPKALSNTEQIGHQGGFSALHYAAREGFHDAALLLIEAGTEVDLRSTGDRSTPMLVAVINGNFDLAMELLERGADPNAASEDGATALFAAINQEWHLRTWYPQPTANQQQETSYLELMEALLVAGADPDARVNQHIWYAAYNAGRMGVDFTGATAFWRAAYAVDVEAMRLLVRYGADPDIRTMKLPDRRGGFNLNATFLTDGDETPKDPSGLPEVAPGGAHVHPLHAASGVGFGTSRVAQQHRHAPDGWIPAVKYLIEELGVDVNLRDADGFSALHNAAGRGDTEMVMYLVEQGADVTVVSRRGHTTVDMANSAEQRTQPYPETIALLESLGAINSHNCRVCN